MIEFKSGTYGYIAQKDIEGAMRIASSFPTGSGVYAQQAVEKMLKQYLKEVKNSKDTDLYHTHNLRRLFSAACIDAIEPYRAQLYDLSDAYFNTRYPGDDFWELTPEVALTLCTVAAAIVNAVELEIAKFRAGGESTAAQTS